jgi:hypothetical protein
MRKTLIGLCCCLAAIIAVAAQRTAAKSISVVECETGSKAAGPDR